MPSEADTTLRVMLTTFLPNEKVATVVAAEDQHGVTNAIAGAAKWQDRQQQSNAAPLNAEVFLHAACRELCVARFNLLKVMCKENTIEMLVLLELFYHDIRRQSLLLVRPQNRGAIEFLGIGVWLWQHFDGTASRPSLPTW